MLRTGDVWGKRWTQWAAITLLTLTIAPAYASNVQPAKDTKNEDEVLKALAISALDVAEGKKPDATAAAKLREAGPAGLVAALSAYTALSEQCVEFDRMKMQEVLDRIAAQKDAASCGLYWFTDLEKAQALAAKENKPILSLRLLGKLDEEYSCANSRFFRTALYANEKVAAHLRENFVLHWRSVRPVPVVTIDFGDGRTVKRTITGNSVHYVLDPTGRPVDAIPGLYGPQAFLHALVPGEALVARIQEFRRRSVMPKSGDPMKVYNRMIAVAHMSALNDLRRSWQRDLGLEDGTPRNLEELNTAIEKARQGRTAAQEKPAGAPPTARQAAPVAVTKTVAEFLLVKEVAYDFETLEKKSDEAFWKRIAARHLENARMDDNSKALMRAKYPTALEANARSVKKRMESDPIIRVVANFETNMALDTVRNEYLLRRKIHDWFANGDAQGLTLDPLNEKVYAELFLTPSSDPWLGLVPANVYSALPNEGLCVIDAKK